MQTSCGIIHLVNSSILLCHVTYQPQWDVPKGCKEEQETPKQAAIREFYEETGVVLSIIQCNNLIDLGEYDYLPKKRLHLFLLETEKAFYTDFLSCSSMVKRDDIKDFPEVDKYEYVALSDIKEYTTPRMFKALKTALIRRSYEILD